VLKPGVNNNAGKVFDFRVRETTVNRNWDWKAGSSSWPAVKNEYQVYGSRRESCKRRARLDETYS